EVPVAGARPHAGPGGGLVERRVGSRLGEHRVCGRDDPIVVAPRVHALRPSRGHQPSWNPENLSAMVANVNRRGSPESEEAVITHEAQVGVWTFAFDGQPAGRVREAAAEIEELGYGAIWYGEGFGRDTV